MARFKPRQFGVGGYGYCKPKPSHSTKSIYKQSDNELKDQKPILSKRKSKSEIKDQTITKKKKIKVESNNVVKQETDEDEETETEEEEEEEETEEEDTEEEDTEEEDTEEEEEEEEEETEEENEDDNDSDDMIGAGNRRHKTIIKNKKKKQYKTKKSNKKRKKNVKQPKGGKIKNKSLMGTKCGVAKKYKDRYSKDIFSALL